MPGESGMLRALSEKSLLGLSDRAAMFQELRGLQMLIDHPLGMGKRFVGESLEPALMSPQEIIEVASHLGKLIDQSYVMVAILVADNFPESEMWLSGNQETVEFKLYFKERLMLNVDDAGWKVEGEDLRWKWEDIKEGNPESVAQNILQSFAQRGYSVFDPSDGIAARRKVKRPLVKFENWLEEKGEE